MPDKYWILVIGGGIALLGIGSNIRVRDVTISGPGKIAGAVVGCFGGLIAAIGLVYALWPQYLGLPAGVDSAIAVVEKPSPTPSPTPPPSFKFVGVPGTVPRCVRFTGTGELHDGNSVALFDHPTGGGDAEYYFDGLGKVEAGSWIFPEVTIGDADDAGVHVEIVAVIVDEATAKYLSSIDSGSDEAWFSSALPGPVADRAEVVRTSNSTPCD